MKNKNKYLSIRRDIKIVNWLGLYTLYLKEVKRFTSVFLQTITAPMVTTLLFVVVFSIAIDRSAGIKGCFIYFFFNSWPHDDECFTKCFCKYLICFYDC